MRSDRWVGVIEFTLESIFQLSVFRRSKSYPVCFVTKFEIYSVYITSQLSEMAEINIVEANLTRHKLITSENGEVVRAEGHIVVFDNIGKCHKRIITREVMFYSRMNIIILVENFSVNR